MADFVKIVKKHLAANPGDTFFLPAPRPGPLVPSEESVLAFCKIRGLLSYHFSHIEYSSYEPKSPFKMSSLQNYVLNPTHSNWQLVTQIVREEQMEKMHADLKFQIPTKSFWENIQPLIKKLEDSSGSKLSGSQVTRVNFLAQVECIIGESRFDATTCVQILPGRSIANSVKNQVVFSWGSEYYDEQDTIPVLQKVYYGKLN